jgi:hypothetical protein
MEWRVFTSKEYPELLRGNIGCSVPGPWGVYVKRMLDIFQNRLENNKEFSTLRVLQIKEKFGSLHVYFDFDPNLDEKSWFCQDYYKGIVVGIIAMTDELCANTCVECGSQVDVINTTKKDGGWISPRCPNHR